MKKEEFLKYQSFTWDASRDNLIPLTQSNKDDIEITDIFHKAIIVDVKGNLYNGYIHDGLWTFSIYFCDERFGFNSNLMDWVEESVKRLLKNESASLDDFFPVSYQIENNEFVDEDLPLSGIIDFRPNLK